MGVKASTENILTPEFRASFPDVFKPNTYGGKETYQIVMLFPKEQDLTSIKNLIKEAAEAAWPGGKGRPDLTLPDFKVSDKDYDGYEDHVAIRAGSQYPPGVVDGNRQEIIKESDFYAGCYARAQINAYVWEFGGKFGISFGLQNVQKLRDGDLFGNRVRPDAAFDDGYVPPEGFDSGDSDIFNDPSSADEFDDSDIPL